MRTSATLASKASSSVSEFFELTEEEEEADRMPALYVAYTANDGGPSTVTGWATFLNVSAPKNTADIEALCTKVKDLEGVIHVIPLWWQELPGE